MNQYINAYCRHGLVRNSCQICNEVQPMECSQFETRIKQYEEQLKVYKTLVKEQDKKIIDFATKLAYANRHIEIMVGEEEQEPQEPQYLYVYNSQSKRETWMSPTLMQETYGWNFMGKVRVEK